MAVWEQRCLLLTTGHRNIATHSLPGWMHLKASGNLVTVHFIMWLQLELNRKKWILASSEHCARNRTGGLCSHETKGYRGVIREYPGTAAGLGASFHLGHCSMPLNGETLGFYIHGGMQHNPYLLNLSLLITVHPESFSRTVTVTSASRGCSVNVVWYREPSQVAQEELKAPQVVSTITLFMHSSTSWLSPYGGL